MVTLMIDYESVASASAPLQTAGLGASKPSAAAITPAAADPVSMAVAATLQARSVGIGAYSTAGAAVAATRGQQLIASASSYAEQEAANAASLHLGASAAPTIPGPAVPAAVALPAVPAVAAPAVGAPPGRGEEIAQLIHAGPGSGALHTAARQLRNHAAQLRDLGDHLMTVSSDVTSYWPSDSGLTAAHQVARLGSWHAEHAEAAATAMVTHADSFDRAKANIPTPAQFTELENRLKQAAAANSNPATLGRYAPVVSALQTQLSAMNTQATTHYASYSTHANDPSIAGDPLAPPPQPRAAVGPDDTIVGTPGDRQVTANPVDFRTGPPLPQEPAPPIPPPPGPPPPPVTGPPIRCNPPPTPPMVIDASPPDGAPAHQPGFPNCATSDNLKHIAEMLAGLAVFGIALPADIPSLGAATPGLLSGGYMVYDGFDELRKCTG